MKTTLLALVFIVALSSKPLHGAAGAAPEQVVDTSGKKLRAGANYYIVSASPNVVVGLSLAQNEDCPLNVVVADDKDLPLTFTPVNSKKGVVRVSTDLNICFSAEMDCPQSTVWKLDDYD